MPKEIDTFMIKAIIHDCENTTHKPVVLEENGKMVELLPSTSKKTQQFIEDKADKYNVPIYYTESCAKDKFLKDFLKDGIKVNPDEIIGKK